MNESGSTVGEVLNRVEEQTGVVYKSDDGSVDFATDKNDTEHFVDFVRFLFEQELVAEDDLPYTPGYGKIRYLLNTDSVHQDGREMSRPVNICQGIYLETNHDSESKRRYIVRMIEDFIQERK